MPTNIVEDVEVNGVRWINPIKVKSGPDHSYITIDLTEESATLSQCNKEVTTKGPSEYVSYDEMEIEDESYLPDDVPIPIESDSSEAKTFADKYSIKGINTDSLQQSQIK